MNQSSKPGKVGSDDAVGNESSGSRGRLAARGGASRRSSHSYDPNLSLNKNQYRICGSRNLLQQNVFTNTMNSNNNNNVNINNEQDNEIIEFLNPPKVQATIAQIVDQAVNQIGKDIVNQVIQQINTQLIEPILQRIDNKLTQQSCKVTL